MSTYLVIFSFVPPWLLEILHLLSGLVLLAEALNKLERTDPFARGQGWRMGLATWMKVVAWCLLAAGGAGALATPVFRLPPPTLQDVAVIFGFALLVVRSRLKEKSTCAH